MEWLSDVDTPAFVLDLRQIHAEMARWRAVRQETGARVLYALKPLVHPDALATLAEGLDGFAASSLFEAQAAKDYLRACQTLCITTPAYSEDQWDDLTTLCDQIVLNSLGQWERLGRQSVGRTSIGLRVNPGLSYVEDDRYNTCRRNSKLGVPIAILQQTISRHPEYLNGLEGIHFHTNSDSADFAPLQTTVNHLIHHLKPVLRTVQWINLGGGYLLTSASNLGPLYETIALLHERYPSATVYLEPGASLIRDAGYLVTTVLDLLPGDDTPVAILDTTVNHAPEVFEYQFEPRPLHAGYDFPHRYILAGATCLAGDLFGTHTFPAPLTVGSRIAFPDMGAYTWAKAHWFNGVNLPTLYTISADGILSKRKSFDFAEYRSRMGWTDTA
jgi:carboxynorspermidine decarboxylase